jgi:hypothetical protein
MSNSSVIQIIFDQENKLTYLLDMSNQLSESQIYHSTVCFIRKVQLASWAAFSSFARSTA